MKAEFADIENLRNILETKEEMIKELKRLHKMKVSVVTSDCFHSSVLCHDLCLSTINY